MKGALDYRDIRWSLIRDVTYALDMAVISIPYPHMQMVSSKA